MIHNKYFHILKYYTSDLNRLIYARELENKIPISQKGIANTMNELEKKGILKSKFQGNLKLFFLNKENPLCFDIILQTEIEKKIEFFEKKLKIKYLFEKTEGIIGIYGSHAKNLNKQDSDLDIFTIGESNLKTKELGIKIDEKKFTKKEFAKLLNEKNPLIKEIIENHILIRGFENFLELIWNE